MSKRSTLAGKLAEGMVRELLNTMTDHVTDKLFAVPGFPSIVFPLSRLIVDPARFPDDAHESTASKGMGVTYERGPDGRRRPSRRHTRLS